MRRQETDCHLFSLRSRRKKVHSCCCKTIISTIQIFTDENWNGSSVWKLPFFLYRENTCLNHRDHTEKSVAYSGECGDFSHAMQVLQVNWVIVHTDFLWLSLLSILSNGAGYFTVTSVGLALALPLHLYFPSYVEANRFLETSTKRRLWSLLVGDAIQPPPQYICKCVLTQAWKEGVSKTMVVACFTASQKPLSSWSLRIALGWHRCRCDGSSYREWNLLPPKLGGNLPLTPAVL